MLENSEPSAVIVPGVYGLRVKPEENVFLRAPCLENYIILWPIKTQEIRKEI